MRRSADFVIGALGVLKAGAAYVPLDPNYPKNRLTMLLEDSGLRLVVTHPCVAKQLPQGSWQAIVVEACALNRDADSALVPTCTGAIQGSWRTPSSPPDRPAGQRACRLHTRTF